MVAERVQVSLEVKKLTTGLREYIEQNYLPNRERALALTKLDECSLWLKECEIVKDSRR